MILMQAALLYGGSAAIALWGIGHLIPTRNVVSGFGPISKENARIITMEWLIEGLTLCFLGILVALTAALFGLEVEATHLVARACALMLLVLAVVSSFTGARTSILPMKLCPYVKSAVAVAFLSATIL
jgi:hypothetical protein